MFSLFFALSLARAQSTDDADGRARQFYDNGAMLYEEGRYEDAIIAFEEAYRLSPRPALLFNIANAEERAGRWANAMETLGRYRVYAPAIERETLDRRIRNIERRLDEMKATAPVERPPVAAATPAPKPAAKVTVLRPVPLALGGVGLVSLGVGAGFGVAALASRAEAATYCTPVGDATYCPDAASEALAADKQNAMLADISLGVGTASLLAGVALGLWGTGGPLSVSPGMITWQGRF